MATTYLPHLRRLGILLALTSFLPLAQAHPSVHYRVIELGGLGGVISVATGINDRDVVVGNAQFRDGHVQAFYWTQSNGIQRVDTTGRESRAFAISNRGAIAGAYTDDNHLTTAVYWTAPNKSIEIAEAPFGAFATAINDRNQLVGYREDGIFSVTDNAFSWPPKDPTYAWTNLFNEDDDSYALGINNHGQVVGYIDRQAFRLDPNGKMTILAGSSSSGFPAAAVAINNNGATLVSQAGVAYLYEGGRRLRIAGSSPLTPVALNVFNTVVGYFEGNRGAFVWEKETGVRAIDNILVTRGWHINSANGINRFGWIVGDGMKNGRHHAVLLIPVITRDNTLNP